MDVRGWKSKVNEWIEVGEQTKVQRPRRCKVPVSSTTMVVWRYNSRRYNNGMQRVALQRWWAASNAAMMMNGNIWSHSSYLALLVGRGVTTQAPSSNNNNNNNNNKRNPRTESQEKSAAFNIKQHRVVFLELNSKERK